MERGELMYLGGIITCLIAYAFTEWRPKGVRRRLLESLVAEGRITPAEAETLRTGKPAPAEVGRG